ncbi:hypothetical protein VZT92_016581 [Zoarces viviparus]|uniref:Uncharacterized protein n=1 Tax=Zoarces viviparus TaxID=48416 RepID=A0AAW1EV74_ZOAVI
MDINHLQNASDQAVGHINHLNCQIDAPTEINRALATGKAILCSWWDEGTLRTSHLHEIQNTESKKRSEQEAEISYLKESLILKEEEEMHAAQSWSKQEYDIMVARYEAERQVSARKTQMCEVQCTDEYQSNMNHVQEELHYKNSTILDLSQRLSKKHAELAQKEKDWVEKEELMQGNIDRLGDEKKAMAVKFENNLSQKQGEFMAILQNVTQEWKQQEDKIYRRDVKIMELLKEKECQKLTETTDKLIHKEAEVLQSENVWKEKYEALGEKSTRELAQTEQTVVELQEHITRILDERKQLEGNFREHLSEKEQLMETMQTMDQQGKQQDKKIVHLIGEMAMLSQQSDTVMNRYNSKLTELLKLDEAYRKSVSDYQKKVNEAQAKREQDWAAHHKLMQGNIECLHQKLTETTDKLIHKEAEVLQSENVWKEKYEALGDKSTRELAQIEQTAEVLEEHITRILDERKQLEGNFREHLSEKEQLMETMQTMDQQGKHQDKKIVHLIREMAMLSREYDSIDAMCNSKSKELLQIDGAYRKSVRDYQKRVNKAQAKSEHDWAAHNKLMQGIIDRLEDEKKAMAVEFENNLSKKLGEFLAIMQNVTQELKQQEDKIYWRDIKIMDLLKEKECLHQKLTETTDKLIHKEAEVLQKSSGARLPEPEPEPEP